MTYRWYVDTTVAPCSQFTWRTDLWWWVRSGRRLGWGRLRNQDRFWFDLRRFRLLKLCGFWLTDWSDIFADNFLWDHHVRGIRLKRGCMVLCRVNLALGLVRVLGDVHRVLRFRLCIVVVLLVEMILSCHWSVVAGIL